MTYISLFGFLVLAIIVLSLVIFVFYITVIGHIKGAPFVRSTKKEIRSMMHLAAIKKNELVFDLGSGDGTILTEAAKKGAKAVGIELNPFLVWYSRMRVKLLGYKNKTSIIQGDFRNYSVRGADVVFFYLLPKTVYNLQEKLAKELKVGGRVVSNGIAFKGWKPAMKQDNIFLYKKSSN